MKSCTKCGQPKPLDQFGKSKRSNDKLQWWCYACHAQQARAWRLANPERSREIVQKANAKRRLKPCPNRILKRQLTGATDQGRLCVGCRAFKAWSEFSTQPNGPNGHTSRCRPCARAARKPIPSHRRTVAEFIASLQTPDDHSK